MAGGKIVLSYSTTSSTDTKVTIKITMKYYGNGVSFNNDSCPATITFNGTTKSFSHSFTTSTSAQTLGSASFTVTRNDYNSKTLTAKGTFATSVSLGTLTDTLSITILAKLFTTTFNPDNGDSSIVKTHRGLNTTTPSEPVKAGYDFNGWIVNGVVVGSEASVEAGNITCLASWTNSINNFWINYQYNNDKIIIKSYEVTTEGITIDETIPGYEIEGWRINGKNYSSETKFIGELGQTYIATPINKKGLTSEKCKIYDYMGESEYTSGYSITNGTYLGQVEEYGLDLDNWNSRLGYIFNGNYNILIEDTNGTEISTIYNATVETFIDLEYEDFDSYTFKIKPNWTKSSYSGTLSSMIWKRGSNIGDEGSIISISGDWDIDNTPTEFNTVKYKGFTIKYSGPYVISGYKNTDSTTSYLIPHNIDEYEAFVCIDPTSSEQNFSLSQYQSSNEDEEWSDFDFYLDGLTPSRESYFLKSKKYLVSAWIGGYSYYIIDHKPYIVEKFKFSNDYESFISKNSYIMDISKDGLDVSFGDEAPDIDEEYKHTNMIVHINGDLDMQGNILVNGNLKSADDSHLLIINCGTY